MRWLPIAVVLVAAPTPAMAQDFSFDPPGALVAGSGEGATDTTIYAPGMLFPIADGPAYANSQVYGHGGYLGPGGGQCDAENYSYPWQDNYCETRSWNMPLCPSGNGHQGQDIRPATCEKDIHPAVAAADGTITNIGSYSVYLTADDGTRYDYLHMSNVAVSSGQEVTRGQVLGMVSNKFGGTATTIHLHFNIRQFVEGIGSVYVPTYPSLVASYQELIGVVAPPETGTLDSASCSGIDGQAAPEDTPGLVLVQLVFDESGVSHDVPTEADKSFAVQAPLSLFDGVEHAVEASVAGEKLSGGPLAFTCAAPAMTGERRLVDAAELGLDPFWDRPPFDIAEVDALPIGPPLSPQLVQTPTGLHVLDGEVLRPTSPQAAKAWRFAEPAAHEGGLEIGEPWPARPVLLRPSDGAAYILDAPLDDIGGNGSASSSGSGASPGADPTAPGDNGGLEGHCACEAVGQRSTPPLWGLSLLGLALLRRRR